VPETALLSYAEIVNKCADNEENMEIPNTDVSHAAYLIETLFARAKEEVCVFSGELYDGVFGTQAVQKQAIEFLKKSNSKLKIAYQYDRTKEAILEGAFLKKVLSDKGALKGRVEIWNARKVFQNDGFHFTVTDRKYFRFETEHDSRHAIANFGDKENAQRLARVFDTISAKSQKVFDTIDDRP
jgi:hypothetical protein